MKLLNYMAAGRPIVSFAGSAKGLVHGQTAWLVEDGDVSGFARATIRLLDDPHLARTLGDRARQHVVANCSWDAVAGSVEGVYDRVLHRRRTRTDIQSSQPCTPGLSPT